MTAKIGVITFPGTLDDVDAQRAVRLAGAEAVSLWHADADLKGVDAVVVPGGFSYGDYLRSGAISARNCGAASSRKSTSVASLTTSPAGSGMRWRCVCAVRKSARSSI